MASAYDLVVIGSGSAARTVVATCARAGWRIALVDHRPLGGTCMLRGCDPKKVLISGAEAVAAAQRMQGAGVDGAPRIEWPDLMQFKRSFTDGVPARQEQRYADSGVDVYRDTAGFTGKRSLRVGDVELAAERIVIAAGAEPLALPISGSSTDCRAV